MGKIRSAKLEIRDFGVEFKGQPIKISFWPDEQVRVDSAFAFFETYVKNCTDKGWPELDGPELVGKCAMTALAKAFRLDPTTVPTIKFCEHRGAFYVYPGEAIVLASLLTSVPKGTVVEH